MLHQDAIALTFLAAAINKVYERHGNWRFYFHHKNRLEDTVIAHDPGILIDYMLRMYPFSESTP